MSDPRALRLPRASRIKLGRDFRRLREQGRRTVCGCMVLNWMASEGAMSRKVGVIASRAIGSAVVRNRARRLLLESFRLNQHSLPSRLEMVLVARRGIQRLNLAGVQRDFLSAARRSGLVPTDNATS